MAPVAHVQPAIAEAARADPRPQPADEHLHPSVFLDADAAVVFYNEAAAAVLGRSFEDAGRMSAEQWTETFGPFDKDGAPLDVDGIATTEAIRAGRPAHGSFTIRAANGERISIEASASDRRLGAWVVGRDDPLLAALGERGGG